MENSKSHISAPVPQVAYPRDKKSFKKMEARQLKRDVKALINDYIGQKLREKNFDPKGRGTTTVLDDLAHYDLAVSVACWWLDKEEECYVLDRDIGASSSLRSMQYPNLLEREAMILSSFAGIIMRSLPVEEILALYRRKPAAFYPNQKSKGSIVHPFTLSYHPLAMLGSYKAVQHSKKHNLKLKRWLSKKEKAGAPPVQVHAQPSSSSSSSCSFLSDSSEDRAAHYEASQESLTSSRDINDVTR